MLDTSHSNHFSFVEHTYFVVNLTRCDLLHVLIVVVLVVAITWSNISCLEKVRFSGLIYDSKQAKEIMSTAEVM